MTNARVARIILVLAVVSLPAIYIFFRTGYTGTALDRTLWDIGFYPVKPPSNLVGPGSIYHVTRDGKFYTTICKADEEDTKNVMERSPSEEMIARELQKTNYGLGAEFVQLINKAASTAALSAPVACWRSRWTKMMRSLLSSRSEMHADEPLIVCYRPVSSYVRASRCWLRRLNIN